MKPKELISILKENGFYFARQSGSHAIYKKNNEKFVVVLIHNRDIPKGALIGILKDAGLK